MTEEENEMNMEDWEIPDEIYGEDEAVEIVGDTMDSFLATADVNRVYGVPIEKNGTTVIPAAEILAVAAFGVGYGYGSGKHEEPCCTEPAEEEPEDDGEDEEESGAAMSGGGGGGGGRTFSRPVAVVVISSEGQVSVQPVVDPTKIVLAALTAGGFMVATLLSLFKPRHHH
jgi:uncharacterized spore protein YtfJ